MDITIKNVPSGAEEKVKEMAMVAIERFLQGRDVKVTPAVVSKFESDVDAIRISNGMLTKYAKPKEEQVEPKE